MAKTYYKKGMYHNVLEDGDLYTKEQTRDIIEENTVYRMYTKFGVRTETALYLFWYRNSTELRRTLMAPAFWFVDNIDALLIMPKYIPQIIAEVKAEEAQTKTNA